MLVDDVSEDFQTESDENDINTDNEDFDSNSLENNIDQNSLVHNLQDWSREFCFSHRALDSLLKILHLEGCEVPLDSRTLLKLKLISM